MENNTNPSSPTNVHQDRMNHEIAFEAWKHFANIGGGDKDRMITISTWLLGFSAGIVVFSFSEKLNTTTAPLVPILLPIVGLIISFISGIISLMYGGYANWNWAKADQIANDYKWIRLDPRNSPPNMKETSKKFSLVGLALRLSSSKLPHEKLAPIFYWFLGVSFLSFCVHFIILIWSIISMFLSN